MAATRTKEISVNGKPQTSPAYLTLHDLAERAGIERGRARAEFQRRNGSRGIVTLGTVEKGGGVLVENGMKFNVTRER